MLTEDQQVKMVIANVGVVKIFAALFGLWKHYRNDNLHWPTTLSIAVPAVLIAVLLSWGLSYITYSKTVFQIIFILLLLPMLFRMIFDDKTKKRFNQPMNIKRFFLVAVGLISGSVSALAGLGGGVTVVPLLNSLFNIKIRKVISISLGVIFCVSVAMTIFYYLFYDFGAAVPYSSGAISWYLSLPLVLGVSIAAPLGVSVSNHLTPFTIRVLFACFCLVIIGKTLYDLFI